MNYDKGTPTEYARDVLKKLVMLDWTSDTKEISRILSLERGDGGMTDTGIEKSSPADGLGSKDPLEQYNYGMTGGTYTWTGFQAYTDFLDSRIDKDDPSKKYIILFTDGMDNMLDNSEAEQNYVVNLANELKEKGYTIFCVVLKNDSFDTGADSVTGMTRGARVRDYMAKIAGSKTITGTYDELQGKYIFEADDVKGLTDAFTEQILDKISSSLNDYTVQDYIDPRFDLVDGEGNTIVLGKDGKVTIKDEDGKAVESGKIDELKEKGVIHINNGETATLHYNTGEDRYYLEWLKQGIPGTTPSQNSLTIWSRTFRIKAKEDFIGGNAILSNGNKEKENWVFSPDTSDTFDEDKSSGIDDAVVEKEDDGTGELKDAYVSKGFPRTVVNVRLLTPQALFIWEKSLTRLKLQNTSFRWSMK